MMRRISAFTAVLLAVILAISADNSSNEVFAPFVSRLAATSDSEHIRLSWKNSEDLSGSKRIYRHTAEITDATLQSATMIARVEADVESYIDTPSAASDYYYAVLIEDQNNEPYAVLIPYRNKTTTGIRLTAKTPEETFAVITGITATVSADAVIVQFSLSGSMRELVLYRSTSPIKSAEDLSRSSYSVALAPGTVQVKDIPVAGVDYYYAVIDAAQVGKSGIVLEAGKNATAQPVQIPIAAALTTETVRARTYPLPSPYILNNVETGTELLPPLPFLLPPTIRMQAETEKKVESMLQRIEGAAAGPSPQILAVDQAANPEGDEKTLQTILSETFSRGDYKEAVTGLISFIATRRSDPVEARARFYLGQSYFFRGQYREAAAEFILAEDQYYAETQSWINICLSELSAR